MLIGLWPAPNHDAGVKASEQSSTTQVSRRVGGEDALQFRVAVDVSPDELEPEGEYPPSQRVEDVIPLEFELLMLEASSTSETPIEAPDDIELPTSELSFNSGDEPPVRAPGDDPLGPGEVADEPTGADVLQVMRWVSGAAALSVTASSDISGEVAQVARLAWQAQRQAVLEGADSGTWSSALAYRSGFARVLSERLKASMEPPNDLTVTESAFTITEVRLDADGRAIASFCLVEDSGFGSFASTQGHWGSVAAMSGSIGLVKAAGGWTVDDVGRVSLGNQC